MKYIELKDLIPGDKLILALYDIGTKKWFPWHVKVEKTIDIRFEDLDEPDEIISYPEFHHLKKGKDIFGNKIIEMGVFDSEYECQNWCDFENKINSEYYDNGYDTRTGEEWGKNIED